MSAAPADPPFPTGAAPPPVRRAARAAAPAQAPATAGAPTSPAEAVPSRSNISLPEAPSSWWRQALPVGALVGGMSLLGLSTMLAFRMNFKKAVKDERARAAAEGGASPIPLNLSEAEARRKLLRQAVPGSSGVTVGNIAAKAFLYGTAWCVGGFAVLVGGSCWWLDAWDAPTFASRMQERLPNMRALFEDTLSPLASTVQGLVPDALKPKAGGSESEAAAGGAGEGLTPQDQQDLSAFISFLSEAAGVKPAPSAPGTSVSSQQPPRPLS